MDKENDQNNLQHMIRPSTVNVRLQILLHDSGQSPTQSSCFRKESNLSLIILVIFPLLMMSLVT